MGRRLKKLYKETYDVTEVEKFTAYLRYQRKCFARMPHRRRPDHHGHFRTYCLVPCHRTENSIKEDRKGVKNTHEASIDNVHHSTLMRNIRPTERNICNTLTASKSTCGSSLLLSATPVRPNVPINVLYTSISEKIILLQNILSRLRSG